MCRRLHTSSRAFVVRPLLFICKKNIDTLLRARLWQLLPPRHRAHHQRDSIVVLEMLASVRACRSRGVAAECGEDDALETKVPQKSPELGRTSRKESDSSIIDVVKHLLFFFFKQKTAYEI